MTLTAPGAAGRKKHGKCFALSVEDAILRKDSCVQSHMNPRLKLLALMPQL